MYIRGEEETGDESGWHAFVQSLTEPRFEELETMIDPEHIYSRLVESIAPTVLRSMKLSRKLKMRILQ